MRRRSARISEGAWLGLVFALGSSCSRENPSPSAAPPASTPTVASASISPVVTPQTSGQARPTNVGSATPKTLADTHPSLANLAGRWRLVRQGQSAHVTAGDCDDRIGRILTITATHIAYAGDSCDGHPMLRLKTDCEVHQTTIGSWDLGRYQGNLQDLVHEEVVDVIDTGCSAPSLGPFRELLVLGSGELLTELAGNYYVFRKLK